MGIKYDINERFFEKWSPNMAYVLGYIYADGHLENSPYIRGKYLRITSTEIESLERIKEWLGSKHKIYRNKSTNLKHKDCFLLRIGSHKIYNDLSGYGLHPKKSLTIRFPKIPGKYLAHFIRGYFDGDGCIYFEKSKNNKGNQIIKRIRTIFTSGSKIFLEEMRSHLEVEGIKMGKIYRTQGAFQLKYPTSDSRLLFKIMYSGTSVNSFFMRKFKIFKSYFELRQKYLDLDTRKILMRHSA